MGSIKVPSEVAAALEAQEAADAAIRRLNFDVLSPAVRLRVLEHMETSRRRQLAVSHDVIAGLADEDPAEIGGPIHKVVADWLRIGYAEACRRLRDGKQLRPRLTLTGQELPPELPATASAWVEGMLDGQHLRVIQACVRDLPESIPVDTVENAERFLARQAVKIRPDQLEKIAHQCALRLNPNGKFSDAKRARQRGFTWCGRRTDGMSIGKLVASPELRANLDAWLARFAAPGMCNPDDQTPCVEGEPSEESASIDLRSPAQRQHDALSADAQYGMPESAPAFLAAPGFKPFPYRKASDDESDNWVQPPAARRHGDDGQRQQHSGGLRGAQIVLRALAGGGFGIQARAERLLGPAQYRHQEQRHSSQDDSNYRRLGPRGGEQVTD
jgi:hypothetical protein